jgi:hypothetical protein
MGKRQQRHDDEAALAPDCAHSMEPHAAPNP